MNPFSSMRNTLNLADEESVSPVRHMESAGLKPLWQLFAEIVAIYGSRTAVTFGNEQLTYEELDVAASRLAWRLRAMGVGPESLVGVFVERSAKAIVALVAILKAGGAYLPLDPAYPAERIAAILEDARPKVLITQAELLTHVPKQFANVIELDSVLEEAAVGNAAVDAGSGPENLAYIIYTSGSTGKPKGVMVTHANVARLLSETEPWFHFDQHDVWTLFHSLAFDFSVWEIWACLLTGGRLVVIPFSVSRSPQDFYELLLREGVTVLNQTPSAFYQLISEDLVRKSPALALRVVIFGGEALNFRALQPWFATHASGTPRLINMYGITETTVHVTYREVLAEDVEGAQSLIGTPIPDLQLYLLGESGKPVETGEVGEIYVGGAGVARGYLNRPELNAERFVPDTQSRVTGARMYRSGDLARYLSNGELEYLGRGDAQVKIQGFRIELGEVEAAILDISMVKATRVIPHEDEDGTKRLIAYCIPVDGVAFESNQLSERLHAKLPPWMMPSAYIAVDAFPLTSNGKLDVSALPKPKFGSAGVAVSGGSNELENQVAAIWRGVLCAESIALDDNFFDIGGTSLLLIKVHKELQDLLSRKLQVADLFAYTTVRTLAKQLANAHSGSDVWKPIQDKAQQQRAAYGRARAFKKALS
jgi:amino acid adenylation domain-containing protein